MAGSSGISFYFLYCYLLKIIYHGNRRRSGEVAGREAGEIAGGASSWRGQMKFERAVCLYLLCAEGAIYHACEAGSRLKCQQHHHHGM